MRKPLALTALLAAAALATSAHAQQSQPRDTTITMSVSRSGRAVADRATLYMGVEALAETPLAAVERVQARLKAMGDSIRRVAPGATLDVPIIFGAGPTPTQSYPPPPVTLMVARGAVRVQLSKVTDIPLVQTAAVAAGATMVGAVAYEASATDVIWKAKSAEALSAAQAVAAASADSQGYRLGRLLSMNVSGGPVNNGFQQQLQLNFDTRNTYQTTTPADTQVTASVSVTYLLVKK